MQVAYHTAQPLGPDLSEIPVAMSNLSTEKVSEDTDKFSNQQLHTIWYKDCPERSSGNPPGFEEALRKHDRDHQVAQTPITRSSLPPWVHDVLHINSHVSPQSPRERGEEACLDMDINA